jgi:hypothetical protein
VNEIRDRHIHDGSFDRFNSNACINLPQSRLDQSASLDDGHVSVQTIEFRRCLEAVEDRGLFWLKVLESSRSPKNPKDNITEWLELISQPSLLDTPADGIELGVFNQWHSAGPMALHSNRLTRKDLQIGPEWISRGSTAPICREHFWQRPERIWVADVVSRREGDGMCWTRTYCRNDKVSQASTHPVTCAPK